MMNDRIAKSLERLKRSSFRSKFTLNHKDISYVQDKGIDTIRQHAIDFIASRIAPQFPKNDGKQTPMKGYPVFIAQHATATCCRGCLQKWHGIEKGRVVTSEEKELIVDLIMGWIEGEMGIDRLGVQGG